MSSTPQFDTQDRGERTLAIVERVVTDSTGLKVRIHAFVITLALSLSLATAPTVGVTPSITTHARSWAIAAILVGVLQGVALLVGREPLVRIASVVTSMICFAIAFMTLWDAPTSFVGYGFLSLGLCCVLPTLRPLF